MFNLIFQVWSTKFFFKYIKYVIKTDIQSLRLNTHCEIFKYLKLHSFRTSVQFQKKKKKKRIATFFIFYQTH